MWKLTRLEDHQELKKKKKTSSIFDVLTDMLLNKTMKEMDPCYLNYNNFRTFVHILVKTLLDGYKFNFSMKTNKCVIKKNTDGSIY